MLASRAEDELTSVLCETGGKAVQPHLFPELRILLGYLLEGQDLHPQVLEMLRVEAAAFRPSGSSYVLDTRAGLRARAHRQICTTDSSCVAQDAATGRV